MTLVQDLGEEALPEPPLVTSASSSAAESTTTVESQEPSSNEPSVGPDPPGERMTVTTQQRKPMSIPDTVHVRITPETLKDYVGPPIYQKDRMYVHPPPPGVSTGLGYLGNGSGAVMPIEAMVSQLHTRLMTVV